MHMVFLKGQGRAALDKYFLKQMLGRDSNSENSETHGTLLKHPKPNTCLQFKIQEEFLLMSLK